MDLQPHDTIDHLNEFCDAHGLGWFDADAVTIRADSRRAAFYDEKAAEYASEARWARLRVKAARARLALSAWKVRRARKAEAQRAAAAR
jgi:hypothetical protein